MIRRAIMADRIHRNGTVSILALAVLIITSCIGYRYLQKDSKAKTFTIESTEYEDAFSKAIKTAEQLGFHVYNYDKDIGIIHAKRGADYAEIIELDVFLEKDSPGTLSLLLRVKSNKDHETFIKEFVAAYGKYVKITPIEEEQTRHSPGKPL
jgi:hypothetical protein